jgi:hypothetical protein
MAIRRLRCVHRNNLGRACVTIQSALAASAELSAPAIGGSIRNGLGLGSRDDRLEANCGAVTTDCLWTILLKNSSAVAESRVLEKVDSLERAQSHAN